MQTFVGFANGRYIFGSTDGFLNYQQLRPDLRRMLERHDEPHRLVPCRRQLTGPLLLFLQQAGVGGLTVEEAGTQSIRRPSRRFSSRTSGTPTSDLTIWYGIRWEPLLPAGHDHAARSTVLPGVPRQPALSSDGTIPSDTSMWQPRLGLSWDPGDDGKQVIRASAGIFSRAFPV